MTTPARISVALATYNGSQFIYAQLQSLAAQSLLPAEMIVVDDGSTDDTVEIVERFSRSAPFPVRIFRNERNLGYRKNFMRAASLCEGDLICFCDQDDVWSKDKFERVSKAFDDPDVLMVYHNARLVNARGEKTGFVVKPSEESTRLSYEDVEPWRIIPGFSQSIRRSLVAHSPLHDRSVDIFEFGQIMPHDQWFLFLASSLGTVRYLADPLADYRIHDQNTSGWLPARPIAFAVHCITHASYYVRSTHGALQNRVELLREIRKSSPPKLAAHIDEVLAHHDHLIKYVGRRLKLYSEKSFRVRLKLLIEMIRNQTYTDPKAKIGKGNLLLDTFIGVPVGRTLR